MMTLLSFEFIAFLLAVAVPLYYVLPARFRAPVLIVMNLALYTWIAQWHSLLLCMLVAVTYSGARWLAATRETTSRRMISAGIGVMLLSVLAACKYQDALYPLARLLSLDTLLLARDADGGFAVPIGLSFITFRCLGYVMDVYRGTCPAERNLLSLTLFLSFFPQILAGPIERYANFSKNISAHRDFDRERVFDGIVLIAWGLTFKYVIANRLGLFVDAVFDPGSTFKGTAVLVGVYFYAFQIYTDFAGYTYIAIGMARLFAYDSAVNFRQPYFSQTIAEFWTRWHISLSLWLRDYLFLPLTYAFHRRAALTRLSRRTREVLLYSIAVCVTMGVCGVWHGVGWTFLLWGLLHGVYLTAGIVKRQWFRRRKHGSRQASLFSPGSPIFRRLIVFHLVALSWILFRAASLNDAWNLVHRGLKYDGFRHIAHFGIGHVEFIWSLVFIIILLVVESAQQRGSLRPALYRLSPVMRWSVYAGLMIAIELLGVFPGNTQFLYLAF